MPESTPPDRSAIERHFQSVALALVTAVAMYMASFVVEARELAATNHERLASIIRRLEVAQSQLSTLQQNLVTREEWRDHEQRLRELETANRRAHK